MALSLLVLLAASPENHAAMYCGVLLSGEEEEEERGGVGVGGGKAHRPLLQLQASPTGPSGRSCLLL